MDTLGQLVEGNVGATVVIFGLLWAGLVAQGQLLLWFVRRETERLTKHMDDEEEIWNKIRGMERTILQMTANEATLIKVQNLTDSFSALAVEVRDHNRESEGWKRTIVRQDERITSLEKRVGRGE